ncbi:spermidine synthase [Wenyingzhuangia sp. IMCC45533]
MLFKRLISYIWPVTTKTLTDFNGMLEVTYYRGKKMLDSKNANYSYGSLQEIMEFGLDKIDLSKVNSVLLLGLGAGSVIKSLRDKYQYHHPIKAVEFDQKVIEIAKHDFAVLENNQLTIIHDDAFNFIRHNKEQFDLVIADLFVDQKVPTQFYSKEFCDYLYNALSYQGILVFNVGMLQNNNFLEAQLKLYFKNLGCKVEQYDKVLRTNNLLIASK